MPILRRGLFQRRNLNWFVRGKNPSTSPDSLTLSTITEIEDDEYSTSTEHNNERLPRCMSLLSHGDSDHHREGLDQLLGIIRDKHLSKEISLSLIYGESDQGKKLQLLILPFLANKDDDKQEAVYMTDSYADDSQYFSESSFFGDDDDDSVPHGLNSGKYHETALLILLYSLRTASTLSDPETRSIDFASPFWRRINQTLIDNTESNYSEGITTMTLSCLRLLHTLEPTIVEPFLRHLLLPYISFLREYGHQKELPIMQREASRLLSLATSSFSSLQ